MGYFSEIAIVPNARRPEPRYQHSPAVDQTERLAEQAGVLCDLLMQARSGRARDRRSWRLGTVLARAQRRYTRRLDAAERALDRAWGL